MKRSSQPQDLMTRVRTQTRRPTRMRQMPKRGHETARITHPRSGTDILSVVTVRPKKRYFRRVQDVHDADRVLSHDEQVQIPLGRKSQRCPGMARSLALRSESPNSHGSGHSSLCARLLPSRDQKRIPGTCIQRRRFCPSVMSRITLKITTRVTVILSLAHRHTLQEVSVLFGLTQAIDWGNYID